MYTLPPTKDKGRIEAIIKYQDFLGSGNIKQKQERIFILVFLFWKNSKLARYDTFKLAGNGLMRLKLL